MVEFDDAEQAIRVTSSTGHKVTIEPDKIELQNGPGTVKITMDSAGQSIVMEAITSIELKSKGRILLEGMSIDIKGTGGTSVSGQLVKIN